MKGGSQAKITPTAGFTIVEVMIFLAISSFMFIVAIAALSGKQGQTEFSTGLGTFVSQLQTTISNVGTGYYNVPSNITCSASDSGGTIYPELSLRDGTIGQNSQCTYIGEVLEFGTTSGGNQAYTTYPVAGLHYQDNQSPTEATSLATARPETISSIASTTVMPYGLQVASVTYNSGAASTGAIGFMTTFNNYTSSGGTNILDSGSQSVNLDPIPDNSLSGNTSNYSAIVSNIDTLTDDCSAQGLVCYTNNPSATASTNPVGGIQMCVNSGTTNNYVILTFGGSTGIGTINQQVHDGQCP
jgi:competence protein ComGC